MPLRLEAFDGSGAGPVMPPKHTQDYHDGYAAGEAAATAACTAQQHALRAELVQSVSDMAFGFEEARAQITGNLAPLFAVMLQQLLPATLSQGLRDQLHDILMTAAKTDATQPVTLRVHPDQIAAVTDALAEIAHPHLTLSADPGCGPHAALAQTGDGETALDLDAALAQIAGIFDALPTAINRSD